MCWTADEDRCLQPIIAEDDVKVVKILNEEFLSSPYYPDFQYTLNEDMPIVPIKLELSYWQKKDIIKKGYHSMKITPNTRLSWSELQEVFIWRKSIFTKDECLFDAIIPKGTKYYENEYGELVSETIRIVGKSNPDDYEIPINHIDFHVLLKNGMTSTYLNCVNNNMVDEVIGINISIFDITEKDRIFISIKKDDYKEGNYKDAEKNENFLFDALYFSSKFKSEKFLNILEKDFGLSPSSIWATNMFGPILMYINKQGTDYNKGWIPKILQWESKGIYYKAEK